MEDTHALLAAQGYSGAILVPGEDSLWRFYGRMGYEPCTKIRTVDCDAGGQPVALGRIGMEDYARLRRQRLPAGGLLQEGPSLAFLATQAAFYEGEGLLLAARREGERLFAYKRGKMLLCVNPDAMDAQLQLDGEYELVFSMGSAQAEEQMLHMGGQSFAVLAPKA